jgi:hypothetical protein
MRAEPISLCVTRAKLRVNEGPKQEKTRLRIKQFSTRRMKLITSTHYTDKLSIGTGNGTLNRTIPNSNNEARGLTQKQIKEIKSRYNRGNNTATKKAKEGRNKLKTPNMKVD